MKVQKRDGTFENFRKSKIRNALRKAYTEIGEPYDEKVEKSIFLWLGKHDVISVEEIQDVVERILMKKNPRVAKAYILYREQHSRLRDPESLFDASLIDGYINEEDWRVKENANITFSLQGMNMYVAERITSIYWLKKIYPADVARMHLDGEFHIHDLGFLAAYCAGWDLQDLLMSGIQGPYDKVCSKPAKHFDSALTHITNFMYTMTTEAAGAQALSSLDTYLAPFIRYDGLDEKRVYQEIQKFLFNMAVSTKVGGQVPFTNITCDMRVPKFMENQPAIVAGSPTGECYGDFQDEADMFNELLCKCYLEGDAKGRPFTFPIPSFNITSDFRDLQGVWDITAKYGIPYFSNFINSDMKPEDTRSMCCRLRLDTSELKKRGGGLFGSNPLTGSLGVVTINMARLGIISKDDDEFFERLFKVMEVARKSLVVKRKLCERLIEKGFYPYSKFYLRDVKAKTKHYWSNHFSTIGLVGMNEAMQYYMDKSMVDEEAINFSLRILRLMKAKLLEFQLETGTLWNLEATPAEGCSYRLAQADKLKFGKTREYYTNSSQLPACFDGSIIDALNLQDELQSEYTGGTVLHLHLGEGSPEPSALRDLTYRIFKNYKLPYVSWIPQYSICTNCGRIGGHVTTCPTPGCTGRVTPMTRVVGYLRPVDTFNEGKRIEFNERKLFSLQT